MQIVAYYRMARNAPMRKEAQRDVDAYCEERRGKVVRSFFESDGTKRLPSAIKLAKSRSAVLVIPRSVHIDRNLRFLHMLWQSNVRFHICDNAQLTNETIQDRHAEAVQRQYHLREKVKDALAAMKEAGAKLGSARPGHCKGLKGWQGWQQGARVSGDNRTQRAREADKHIEPKILEMLDDGNKLPAIADWLNKKGFVTTAGKPFTPTAVWRIVKRARDAAIA